MNKEFIQTQKSKVQIKIKEFDQKLGSRKKDELLIICNFLDSLLEPNKFTEIQREDLRKLALELDYKEDTDFEKWLVSKS